MFLASSKLALMKVDIFIPCFIDQLYPNTGMNMVKILTKLGCEVNYNPNQTCCGQPAFNAGFFDESQEVAKKCIDDLTSDAEYIIIPSASCSGMIKNSYKELFKNTTNVQDYKKVAKKVFEFTDFVTTILKVDKIEGSKLVGKATYHDSCSAQRECNIKQQPRILLSNVEGLELIEMDRTEDCCGFGGSFAVKFEPISVGMGEQKIEHALATEADYLISTDSSCLMHLGGYIDNQKKPIKAMHIIDVLATGW